MMTKKYRLIEIWCIFLNSFDLLKNRNANSVHGDIYTYGFFFFSVMTYWMIQTVKSIPDQNL